jgi:hypothetical protein
MWFHTEKGLFGAMPGTDNQESIVEKVLQAWYFSAPLIKARYYRKASELLLAFLQS